MKFEGFKEMYMPENPKRKHGHPEEDIQAACVEWFRWAFPRYVIFSTPNGGSRNLLEAVNLKRSGVLAGVSDLIIVADRAVLFVEMKTKTGRQQPSQKKFQADVERLGFEYKICRSLQGFQLTVGRWVNDKFLT